MVNEKKCNFFINFLIDDYQSLGDAYAEIYFFFDYKGKNRNYIYYDIYDKCRNMINFMYDYYIPLSICLDRQETAAAVIEKSIKEIEEKILDIDNDNNFCDIIINELHGKYYKILYNKEYLDNNI